MKTKRLLFPLSSTASLPFAAISLCLVPHAHAASAVWNGSQNTGTWSDTANWSASPVPGTGDTATFNGAGGTVDVIDLGGGNDQHSAL